MSTLRASTAAAGKAVLSKAVHLKIYPHPQNLREGREVLRILQRFGTVEMFKSLRFDYNSPAPNSALAIYRDSESAADLRRASPLRFALEEIDYSSNFDRNVQVAQQHWGNSQGEETAPTTGTALPDDEEVLEHPRIGKSGAEEMIRIEFPLPRRSEAEIEKEEAEDGGEQQDRRRETSIRDALHAAQEVSGDVPIYSPSASTGPPPPLPKTGFPADFGAEPPDHSSGNLTARKTREFHLTADMSLMNYQDIIERAPFYGEFRLFKTPMQDDLANLVPIPGLSEASIKLQTVPGRVLWARKKEEEQRPTLTELWEKGQKGYLEDLKAGRDSFVPEKGAAARKRRFSAT